MTELARHLDPEVLKGWDKYQSAMSSTEQGAATQVWAAIGKEWEGKGQSVVHPCVGMDMQCIANCGDLWYVTPYVCGVCYYT